MTTQHVWPKIGEDYRRHHFNNPRRTVANGESLQRLMGVES